MSELNLSFFFLFIHIENGANFSEIMRYNSDWCRVKLITLRHREQIWNNAYTWNWGVGTERITRGMRIRWMGSICKDGWRGVLYCVESNVISEVTERCTWKTNEKRGKLERGVASRPLLTSASAPLLEALPSFAIYLFFFPLFPLGMYSVSRVWISMIFTTVSNNSWQWGN